MSQLRARRQSEGEEHPEDERECKGEKSKETTRRVKKWSESEGRILLNAPYMSQLRARR
jgi:hypothetical protein